MLFKGNLRGKPANSYEKITMRMQVPVDTFFHMNYRTCSGRNC